MLLFRCTKALDCQPAQRWMLYTEKRLRCKRRADNENSINIVWHPLSPRWRATFVFGLREIKRHQSPQSLHHLLLSLHRESVKREGRGRWRETEHFLGTWEGKKKCFLGSINSFLVWMRPATWKNFAFQAGMNVCFNHTLSSISGQWSV